MAKSFLSFMDSCQRGGSASSSSWCPPADIYQTPDGWLIKLDLAGINPAELRLEARGKCVVVSGERRDAVVAQTYSSYALEISYSRFERCLELPCDVATAQITTEYRDGMLIVRLTCGPEQAQQRVEDSHGRT